MGRILTFGEIMLRLSPTQTLEPLIRAKELNKAYAGAESTVAANIAFWGGDAEFVTLLPENDLGYGARNDLRTYGVITDRIPFREGRMGTYYIEYGSSIRGGKVTYDRQYSAISLAQSKDFDWHQLFQGVEVFFCTGITPALSTDLKQITLEAFRVAKELGVKTAFDLNYRRTLWSTQEAKNTFMKILPFVDILFGNRGVAKDVFGFEAEDTSELINKFLSLCYQVTHVGITHREHLSAQRNGWSGSLFTRGKFYDSQKMEIEVTDRLGTGDAFAAGLLYGIMEDWTPQQTLEFGVAASGVKHTIPGDLCLFPMEGIMEVASGNTSGYIKR